ncbi:hypothetical protein Cfor_06837, partial [Coptotermes formosanus]
MVRVFGVADLAGSLSRPGKNFSTSSRFEVKLVLIWTRMCVSESGRKPSFQEILVLSLQSCSSGIRQFFSIYRGRNSTDKDMLWRTNSHEMGEDSTERYPGSKHSDHMDYGKWRGSGNNDPVFDNNLITNVTAQLGGTAFLHCRVRNLGERPVSWIRRRDWHILTSGLFTYTNDERFQVVHTEGGDDWNLQIKYVQKRDNGTYECQ